MPLTRIPKKYPLPNPHPTFHPWWQEVTHLSVSALVSLRGVAEWGAETIAHWGNSAPQGNVRRPLGIPDHNQEKEPPCLAQHRMQCALSLQWLPCSQASRHPKLCVTNQTLTGRTQAPRFYLMLKLRQLL